MRKTLFTLLIALALVPAALPQGTSLGSHTDPYGRPITLQPFYPTQTMLSDTNADGFYLMDAGGISMPVPGRIYVSPSKGADTGDHAGAAGTTLPVATLAKAIALATTDGYTIELEPGATFNVTAGATISHKTTIHGNGAKLSATSGLNHVLDITSAGAGTTIDNLEINGNGTPVTGEYGNGLVRVNAANCTLRNLYLHDSTENGIEPSAPGAGGLLIDHCRIERTRLGIYSTGVLAPGNVDNVVISYCTIKDVADRGIRFTGADTEYTHVAGTYRWRAVRLIGNSITSTTRNATLAIEMFAGAESVIETANHIYNFDFGISNGGGAIYSTSGNTIRAARYAGIENATVAESAYTGNVIDGLDDSGTAVGGYGIVISNPAEPNQAISVTGNTITNCGVANGFSLQVQEAGRVTVSGNTIKTTYGGGIRAQFSDYVTITGNTIESINENISIGSAGDVFMQWIVTNNVLSGAAMHAVHILNSSSPSATIRVVGNQTPLGATYVNDGNGGILRYDGVAPTPGAFLVEDNYPQSFDTTKGWPARKLSYSFTPSATGWYRILFRPEIEGNVHISDSNSSTTTEWEGNFGGGAYDQPLYVHQLSGWYSHYLPPSITKVRVGRNGGDNALDVFVSTVPAGPITFLFSDTLSTGHRRDIPNGLVTSPPHNPDTTSWVFATLTLSGGAIATTGQAIFKLPTSCTGLDAGTLYNNAGTPAICP